MQTQRVVNVGGSKPVTSGGGGDFPAEAGILNWCIVKPAEDKVNTQKGNRLDLTVFFQVNWTDGDEVEHTAEFRKFYYVIDDENEADFRAFKAKTEPTKDPDKAIKFFKDQLVRLYVAGGNLEEGVQADDAEIVVDDDTIMGLGGLCYFWPQGTQGIGDGGKGPSRYATFHLLTPSEVELVESGEWTPTPEVEQAQRQPTAPAAGQTAPGARPGGAPPARPGTAPAPRQQAAPPARPAFRKPAEAEAAEETEAPATPPPPKKAGAAPAPATAQRPAPPRPGAPPRPAGRPAK